MWNNKKEYIKNSVYFCIFLGVFSNCIIAIHESKSKIPIDNGYSYRCDKKNKFATFEECRADYINRRLNQRESFLENPVPIGE